MIIDFSGQAGKTFTLKNFAVIPFPSGGPVGFGAPDATSDGLVMQFQVNLPLQGTDTSFNPAGTHPALRAAPIVSIKGIRPDTSTGSRSSSRRKANTDDPTVPARPSATAIRQSLINNTKWNGNREGTTIVVPGSTIERARRLGDGDAAPGLDRAVGGRQHHRRRAPDSHPPDPVPGDLRQPFDSTLT